MKLFQIQARNFIAGIVFDDNSMSIKAAPILRKIFFLNVRSSVPLWEVEAFCFVKKWKLIEVCTFKEEVKQ